VKSGFATRRRASTATWLASALLVACANKSGNSPDPDAGGATSTVPDGSVSCANDARLDSYAAGLSKPGLNGALLFRLEQSEPGPPAKGNNTFRLSVASVSGEAVTGDLSIKLKMPDHGHESPTVPVITFDAESASYTVAPVNLFMAGVWQITISAYEAAADAGAPLDSVSFFFCVEG
jgi:hypothetical protein